VSFTVRASAYPAVGRWSAKKEVGGVILIATTVLRLLVKCPI
jgi:hypothetical protein